MAEEADEELIHAGRATAPCGPGGALVAGALTLTRAAVTWRPDAPPGAAARELDVARITGVCACLQARGCSSVRGMPRRRQPWKRSAASKRKR
jgi:hypothetical protein